MAEKKLTEVDVSTTIEDTDSLISNIGSAIKQITLSNLVTIIKEKIGSLKNPYSLTFTGAVSETYDGSEAKTINIPAGGSGDIDLSDYQTKTDDTLTTTSKEVVGAINENASNISELKSDLGKLSEDISDKAVLENGVIKFYKSGETDKELFSVDVSSLGGSSGSGDGGETEKTILSISVTYSGGSVTVGTALTDLTGITVTAHYSDGSTASVTGYTLSGTISEGENTITVSYGGKTAIFMVTGIEESTDGIVDTSLRIAKTGYGLDTSGNEVDGETNPVCQNLCISEFYDIPNEYTGKLKYLIPTSGLTGISIYLKLQVFNDDEFKTYWSIVETNVEKETGLYYASAVPFNKFRFSMVTDKVDDSYMYFADTGDIVFAGKNTQYYGMANIDGTMVGGDSANVTTVAEEIDNQIAMLSLGTGETVNTSAYSSLSSDYVSLVQSNYDAMMNECLGDFNKIPIIVHTDQHGRIGNTNQVMKLIGDMVNWYEISKCMNLGDTCGNTFDATTLQNYLDATKETIPLSKRLDVYGNHDIWDADENQKYTVNQKRLSPYFKNIYAKRHGNNGYFTVLDDYYNVKYLVINNFEYPDTNTSVRRITTAQANFIVDELSKNDGYDIVLVSHNPLDSDEVTSRDETYTAYSEKFVTDGNVHNSFMDMVKARKQKTSGSFTDSEGVAHSYDFTNVSSELLIALHGHAHFEAYRTFEYSITEFIFDWFDENTFYFGYIDRENMKFKCWKNAGDDLTVEALEINI